MRVLLTEDDVDLAEVTAQNLKKHGFAVDQAHSGEEALNLLEDNGEYDAIVLDLNLPDIDGLDLLKELKARAPQTPILALTARDAEADRVGGLQAGFDDYIVKPFSHQELAARLRVLLRSQPPSPPEIIEVGPITLHLQSQIALVNHMPVELTLTEFRLLLFLARNQGRKVSKEEILATVWDRNASEEKAKLETTISRLRKKIGDHDKRFIKTLKSGYTIDQLR